ncbi:MULTISPECIES: hypothetical protein [unclassified Streptomyces]|uniref:hypothetical protein n=1 Tax=unclassified Streptomyces TaxID=2593676 RepID=UPI00131B675C|nr:MULTISPECIES: hypothetical protein [unclassified Streptomyces]
MRDLLPAPGGAERPATARGIDGDEETARWLDAVAELLGLRHVHRFRSAGK